MRKVSCAIHNLHNTSGMRLDLFNYQVLRELENKVLVNCG